MNKYTFLLPLYNDWDSFSILLKKINQQMKMIRKSADILLINDCSKESFHKLSKLSNINKIDILNLKTNLGSQKAISIGLNFLKKNKKKMIITILDSDGEDDSNKITKMIRAAEKNKNQIIVSSRTRRHENIFFKTLYFFHKLLTFIFTYHWISYGNYSSFASNNLNKILADKSSWLAYSAAITKNCKILKLYAERKKRFFGISKLSFKGLINHALRVNAVFIKKILFVSLFYILILLNSNFLNQEISNFLLFFIIFFNFVLIYTLVFNRQKDFLKAVQFIKSKSKAK